MAYNNEWLRALFGGCEYPYTDSQRYNDDWILAVIQKLVEEFNNFANLNKIKYADPISWDITRQYEGNTVVVDARTGNAYISSKPVPRGVQISNTYYWTEIYNYARFIDELRAQIATNEGDRTTASQALSVGQLVFVSGLLYRVIAPIIAGDSFVINSNIVKTTVEAELSRLINEHIIILEEEIAAEAEAREEADTTLQNNIDAEATAREETDLALQNNIDKYNVIIIASKEGAVGDGVTDDTEIIQELIDLSGSTGKPLFLDKSFKVSSLTITNKCEIFGTTGNTGYASPNLIVDGTITIARSTADSTFLHNLSIKGVGTGFIINHATNLRIRDCDIWHIGEGNCLVNYASLLTITGCTFTCLDQYAIELAIEDTYVNINTFIDGNTFGGTCSLMRIHSDTAGYRPEGIVFSNNNTMNTGNECFSVGAVYSLIIEGNTLDQIGASVLVLNQQTEVITAVQLVNNYVGMVGSNPNPIVSLNSVNKLTIRDNHWTGCERIAFLESGTSDVVISGNMLESNDANYPAITVNNSKNVVISNNIIKKTGTNAVAIQCVNATGLSKVIVTSNMIAGDISLNGYNTDNSVNANNIEL